MLEQATRRNRRNVSNLPFPDGFFTKACAINSIQFWPSPGEDLREVHRVLRHGGLLLLGLRIKDPGRRFMKGVGFTAAEVQDVRAGVETRRLPKEQASYVLGRCSPNGDIPCPLI